jgi:hypothetical protein
MLVDTLFPSHSLHHPGLRECDRYFLQGQSEICEHLVHKYRKRYVKKFSWIYSPRGTVVCGNLSYYAPCWRSRVE